MAKQIITLPCGLSATVGGDGEWRGIALASTGNSAMAFHAPGAGLRTAFQSNALFLVIANPGPLGALDEDMGTPADRSPAFLNRVEIDGWRFAARIGARAADGGFSNVMIVKADVTRSLLSLAADPRTWKMPDSFVSPADPFALSEWICAWCQIADPADPDWIDFHDAVTSPDWTGILFLRMSIANVPDPDALFAHHLAIDLGPMRGSPTARSDISGLIRYRETDGPGLVVAGTPIRALDVRFEHSRIASFRIDPPVLSFAYKGVNWLPSG